MEESLKIPDNVLLKNSLIENGKLLSYIDELEEKLKAKDRIISDQLLLTGKEKVEARKDYMDKIDTTIRKLKGEIIRLKKDRDQLVFKLNNK